MEKNELKVANYLMNEAEENEGVVKIYYSDLDLKAREDVLSALEKANPMLDIFDEDGKVLNDIEDKFASTPLFVITGKEISNKINL